MVSETQLLRQIERLPHQTASYKQLIRELSLRGQERRDLESQLADLVVRGKLVLTGRDKYSLPSEAVNRNLVVGRLHTHRDGYGFVTPTEKEVR